MRMISQFEWLKDRWTGGRECTQPMAHWGKMRGYQHTFRPYIKDKRHNLTVFFWEKLLEYQAVQKTTHWHAFSSQNADKPPHRVRHQTRLMGDLFRLPLDLSKSSWGFLLSALHTVCQIFSLQKKLGSSCFCCQDIFCCSNWEVADWHYPFWGTFTG